MEVYRLYPQLNNSDRRQQNTSVSTERRSGIDRRTQFASDSDYADRRINPKLRKDIEEVKDVFEVFRPKNITDSSFKQDVEVGAATSIPYVRRLKSANDAFERHDYFKALGIIFLQFINVKEDWRDITKIFQKPNTPHDYQIPFSFIRGTPLDKFDKLWKLDKTLYDTSLGNKILNKLGQLDDPLAFKTNLKDHFGMPVYALKINGTFKSQILGRMLMRMPILSLLFLSILEIPTILKSKNSLKQTAKSAINVTSIISGGALLGAIGAYLGPLGSLIGLGIGSYYASKLAKKINNSF